MAFRKNPNCTCSKYDGPGCEHDSRVPPMPLPMLVGQAKRLLPCKEEQLSFGSINELADEDSQRERMEPLIAFQRKMARSITVCTQYKNYIKLDMTVSRAARSCPCRLVKERPAETAEEKLAKRLAVVFFLARQWHDKKAGKRDDGLSDDQKRRTGANFPSGNVTEILSKK